LSSKLIQQTPGRPTLSRTIANRVGRMVAPVQFRGKGSLTNWMGNIARQFTDEAECKPVKGASVTISLEERIGRLMWAGCYETELVTLLTKVLSPGMTFVDVGAQVGYFSIIAASMVTENGAVHSFEPDPESFSRLVENSYAYPWIRTYNTVVSNSMDDIPFYRSPKAGESGWGAIFDQDGVRAKITARSCTLDSWRSAQGIEKVDFLKIDVEGAECRVLEGAQDTIAKTRPLMWVEANEVCLSRDAKSVSILLQRLRASGYAVQAVWENRTHSFENVIAVPRERADVLDRVRRARLSMRALAPSAQ
jgi:FkbM family methyltransferase